MAEEKSKPPAAEITASEIPPVRELLKPRNAVNIEVKANFELDEARIFDLNGEGLTVTVVAVN